ncbi:MAG TPA: hypothetical protein VM487_08510 [Phycisphaerae bacterium]|nr:hypothetical protein [Phycisphaerae bacterium]
MPSAEKHKGKCELCDKPNRVIAKIDSGQWVCHTCRKRFGPSNEEKEAARAEARRQPTERQLAFARDLGLDPAGDTRQQLSSLISVGIYVRDVLKELSVTPPPPAEYTPLIRQIARSQALRAKVKEVEQQRYDRAFDEQERIKAEIGDQYAQIDIYSLFPPVPKDKTYEYVWVFLEKALGDRLPKRGRSPR